MFGVAATAQPAPCLLLVALCGLPGSGKSTLCAQLAACAQGEGVACHTVSFDAFEPKGAAFDPTAWKVCFTARRLRVFRRALSLSQLQEGRLQAVRHVDDLLLAGATAGRRVVLVDDTGHLTSMRADLHRLARSHGASF